MKITKSRLRQIIKEELSRLNENKPPRQHSPQGGWPQASDHLSDLEANPSDYETLNKLMDMIKALGDTHEAEMAMSMLYNVEDARTEPEKEEAVTNAISYVRDAFYAAREARRAK